MPEAAKKNKSRCMVEYEWKEKEEKLLLEFISKPERELKKIYTSPPQNTTIFDFIVEKRQKNKKKAKSKKKIIKMIENKKQKCITFIIFKREFLN